MLTTYHQKQATLTAATTLLGIGSNITALDYAKITIGKPTNFQSDWNTTIINKPATFPPTITTIYTKSETDTLLNAKQATLTAARNLFSFGSSISALDYTKITIGKPKKFSQIGIRLLLINL